jgi:hypothetical protein
MRTIALVLLLAATTAVPLPAQTGSRQGMIPGPGPSPSWLAPVLPVESALTAYRGPSRTRWAEGAWIGGIVSSLTAIVILRHDPCGVLGTPDQPCDLGTAMGGVLLQALPGALIGGLIGAAIPATD